MNSSSLAIPLVVAAIALYPLVIVGSAFESFANLFFDLTVIEQGAVLALIFSVVFAAASLKNNHSGTSSTKAQSITYPDLAQYDNEKDRFKIIYNVLKEDILTHLRDEHTLQPEAIDWITQMMDYTVPGGRLNRGVSVVSVCRILNINPLSNTELCQASVLGWIIEFLQAFFLVADDVMDESQTRRGQPCWYKNQAVQMIAINDSFLLESFCFTILKRHFGSEPYYPHLVELLLMVIQKTTVGQLLDLTSQPMGRPADLNRFTLQRYQQIVKYKTSYYTFYLPVAMACMASGVTSAEAYETAERICGTMGEFFQIQNDYLDAYGKPEVMGKIGTDIQDNKCSWLVCQALQRASPSQRTVLLENYGKWDDKKVNRVKALYQELGLEKVFRDYETESYRAIQSELDQLTVMPREVFELLLKKIYKRK